MIDKYLVGEASDRDIHVKRMCLSYCKTVAFMMLPFWNISEKFMLESFECKVTTMLDPDELGANAST